ncbi:MAG: hypothetical protein WCE64_15390 [Bacteroidales bacterium]
MKRTFDLTGAFCIILPVICAFFISFSTGCASSRKDPFFEKRVNASRDNTQHLGRNRYYFSKDYQKKLGKSYKRR